MSRLSNETQNISFISTPIHVLISEIGLESSSPPRNILLSGADPFQLPLQPWDHCEPPRAGGPREYFILEEGGTELTPARFQTMEFHGVSSLAPDPAKSQGPGWNQHIPAEESCPTPKPNEICEVGVKSPQIPDPRPHPAAVPATSAFAQKFGIILGTFPRAAHAHNKRKLWSALLLPELEQPLVGMLLVTPEKIKWGRGNSVLCLFAFQMIFLPFFKALPKAVLCKLDHSVQNLLEILCCC